MWSTLVACALALDKKPKLYKIVRVIEVTHWQLCLVITDIVAFS